MLKTPQIEPVTNFLKDHKAVLEKLRMGPIFLAQRSKPAAVLVAVDEWDHIVEELEHYRLMALADQRAHELDMNPDLAVPWEEVEQELKRRALNNG
jgi:PHD/YefM family antitoxin component YafN of YafNO toxin-antitoxin module